MQISAIVINHTTMYRVAKLKWGQLTFLMVTFECIVKTDSSSPKILLYTQRLTNTSETISRRFYHKILITYWKRKIVGLCEYVRVNKMRNITRAKVPNFGADIWWRILNIKLMLPKVCAWETVITFNKNYWILPMHSNVTIKVGLTLAGPPCIDYTWSVVRLSRECIVTKRLKV